MRPVEAERPISLPTLAGVLLLAAGMTALLTGAFAQEVLPRLRGVEDGRTPSAGAAGGRDLRQASAGSGRQRRVAPQLAQRRAPAAPGPASRQPTAAPVRGAVRAAVLSPNVAREVQPIQVGVPDPAAPALARRRRRPVEEDPYSQLGLRLGGPHRPAGDPAEHRLRYQPQPLRKLPQELDRVPHRRRGPAAERLVGACAHRRDARQLQRVPERQGRQPAGRRGQARPAPRRQPRHAGRCRGPLPARHAAAGQPRPQRRRDRAPARHDDRRRRRA